MGWGDVIGVLALLACGWLAWRVFITWAKVRAGRPDFVIGDDYLRRWWVLPRNRLLNLYLHNIRHDDEDRALHDHPWWNCSVVLKGGYREVTPLFGPGEPGTVARWRGPGSIVRRPARAAHRLVVDDGEAWTLFITGPRIREWGFWCPKGFVPWQDFVDPNDIGAVGRGCGETQPKRHSVQRLDREEGGAGTRPAGWPSAAEFHGDA